MNDQKIKIELISGNCIGVATCTEIMGQIFSIGEDGRVKLNKGDQLSNYANVTLDQLIEAAESCPTLAIKVINEDTGEIIFPK
jgi:ferredoxin